MRGIVKMGKTVTVVVASETLLGLHYPFAESVDNVCFVKATCP